MRNFLLATAATMGALLATTGGAFAQPVTAPAPGTVVVHLNGYLQFAIGDMGTSVSRDSATNTKLNSTVTDGDARLYSGFDAQTLNGIDYGAQIELRTTTSDSGQGAQKNSGSGDTAGTEGIYVKRAYGYLGTPTLGFVRLGQTDGAFELMQTGVIESFGDGAQWTTDGGVASMIPTDASVAGGNNFIYADTSALYATDKLVYITPAFMGLSGIVSYEPNSNGLKEGFNACADATTTCSDVDSEPGSNSKDRQNTVDAMVQYAGTADGFATKVSGGFLQGSPINNSTGPQLFDDLQVYQFGAQTTYAGLTVGANIKGGQTLDGYSFKQRGTRDALAYSVGADYVLGPYVIGTSFFDSQTAGAATATNTATVARTLSEYGVAVGGNYVIGKDLSLFVQYMYDHRHQHGNTGLTEGVAGSGNAQAQIIATGATFKW
jgi:Gram-negative porin